MARRDAKLFANVSCFVLAAPPPYYLHLPGKNPRLTSGWGPNSLRPVALCLTASP